MMKGLILMFSRTFSRAHTTSYSICTHWDVTHFNLLQPVLTIWQTYKLVRWEHHLIKDPAVMTLEKYITFITVLVMIIG